MVIDRVHRRQIARLAIIAAVIATMAPSTAQPKTTLPNGWSITPAGTLVKLGGDMPLRIIPAPDGHSMLVVTGGYHDHAIDVIEPESGTLRQHLLLGKAWAGLAAERDESTVYVSGGGPETKDLAKLPERAMLAPEIKGSFSSPVVRLAWNNGALTPEAGVAIAGLAENDRFIAGLALDHEKHLLALNIQTDTLYKIDLASGQILRSATLGYRPFEMALSSDGAHVAIANWGDKSVSLLDATDLRERARVPVGIHPTDLAFGPDGRLFVANAGSNSVSVIRGDRVAETIMTSLHAGDPVGSTPNAVAVAADGSRLYVANADNNDIAVIDIHNASHSKVLGFIPTGWYPSTLALTPDGKRLVVGIAKGIGSRGNSPAQLPVDPSSATRLRAYSTQPFDYVGNIMTGYAEIIAVPDEKALARYTRRVAANSPVGELRIKPAEKREAETAFRQIKHVIYVIRENRTYDQVLGDDPRGDGKPELAFFGAAITPNAHRLAHDTVLLDRYFVNGEVSEDGHNWANQAYATAFNERTTASSYGGRGEPFGDERLEYSPAGHLWDAAKRAGLSYFSYGEGADFTSSETAPPTFSGTLKDHASPDWGDFITKTDVDRAHVFVRDLKAHEEKDDMPAYTVVWLPWDHTVGLTPKAPTPQATVAINDLALGMLVEAVSHSRFWRSTAIFVTEDDAQAGPDHVDDHRTVALVISPYVKQSFVDHTHYTMTSMIRTMELILHLPPMTQYDRDATPMYRLFQSRPRDWTYSLQQETVDLRAVNPSSGPLEKASLDLDFSAPDRADPQKLNAILWAAMRPGVSMPAPVTSAH
jgi:YVTN family beta-propeller protein